MSDIVGKLWGFCNTLRHDGINYGDYIEQLTYLLFLKIADEKKLPIPKGYGWQTLKEKSGTELLDHYNRLLRNLSKENAILKDIFAGSLSRFREPVNLKKLIALIDETRWGRLDIDIKAQAYEGLLQKFAAEQKGAGQYFTPREAIRAVIRCVKPVCVQRTGRPDFRKHKEYKIHDPACGTGGFLIGAYEWIMSQTHEGADLRREDRQRLQKKTFSGTELVLETRRLAMMNLYLHEIEADIYYGDSIYEPDRGRRYDCVLTNPPFGTKGGGQPPVRDDFTVQTSNKQLNFIQHLMTILKPGGQAAIVLPDNVLFEEHAGRDVRKILMTDCNLHTILRLPIGTFTPYSTGVKANILFFQKGMPTEEVWIYDLRTNIDKVTKGHPLTAEYFKDFEACYNLSASAKGRQAGKKKRKETERFRRFTREEIAKRDDNLDIFWLKDESLEDSEDLPEPEDLAAEAVGHLQTALDELNDLVLNLEPNAKNNKRKK